MILAIDYGKRKIGLAISDETLTIAQRLPILVVKNDAEAIKKIVSILDSSKQIDNILIGLPLGLNLSPTQISKVVKEFTNKLRNKINEKISITFINEVLTSKKACIGKSRKFKKEKLDAEAARIMLQEYLDHMNLIQSKMSPK